MAIETKKLVGAGCIEGWACPGCGQYKRFWVEGCSIFEIQARGTDQCSGVEWSDASRVECPECGWKGTVKEVVVPEEE